MKISVKIALAAAGAVYLTAGSVETYARQSATAASSTGPLPAESSTNSNGSTAIISFVLKPTAIAPHGAGGTAEVRPGVLALHLSQLGPGKYALQAVRRSNGAVEPLGVITIVDPTLSPSRQATDNKKEASANPESVQVQTDATVSLPKEVPPRDIKRVMLLGPGDNAVLDSATK